jgi:aspartate dehydrogenase
LIGFGACGRAVASMIAAGQGGAADIVGVLVRDVRRYRDADKGGAVPFVASLPELLVARPGVVVEVAGHEALAAYGETVLASGLILITLSSGLLADDARLQRLLAAAAQGGGRLILPSGAIAALDAIESAAFIGIDRVVHVVRKPPLALLPPDEAQAVSASGVPRELYRGPAREAARLFPANVNVVALVALAGVGMDATEAVVIADPSVERNTHEVTVEGLFGSVEVRVRNVPTPGQPKTGLIVAGSVVRAIRRLRAQPLVGG